MKNKIKEAITQGYKNLGVPESVVDGLAALGVTVVKEESEIGAFVQGEAVKGVMRTFQSETDKVRTEYSTKLKGLEAEKAELEAKLTGNKPEEKPGEKEENPDFKAMVDEAVAAFKKEVVEPLQNELATIKATKAKEDAVAALDTFVNDWDYAGGFPTERDMAKRVALKVYRAGGEKMSGDELIAAFREEFDPAVKAKGVTDFSQPFKSDGAGGESKESDKAFAAEIRKALGKSEEE